ncbi:MAG: uroporphyrinogen decarboxylase family protein [Anaerolineae bacterium]
MYLQQAARIGGRGVPYLGLAHPLGTLVRQANMQRVYLRLLSEPALMHRFLENTNRQVVTTLQAVGKSGVSGWFFATAHEMLIPPWIGHRLFDEVVFPYDKTVNDAVHAIGGKHRSHCHGSCMDFLVRMSEMGGRRHRTARTAALRQRDSCRCQAPGWRPDGALGNIPSQDFVNKSTAEVRQAEREAIAAAAPGGGFTLRATGGNGDIDPNLPADMLKKIIENVEAFIEAGLEYGGYPIQA